MYVFNENSGGGSYSIIQLINYELQNIKDNKNAYLGSNLDIFENF